MTKLVNGQAIIQAFERWSPKSLAVDGDKIGLQIGTLNKPIKKVMVVLDLLETVVDEAIKEEVDLIIAHHPIIFRPLKAIQTDRPYGRVVEKLIKHDITVYVAHTNLDVTKGGVNDLLAEKLGLVNIDLLAPTTEFKLKKLVVFVPKDHANQVREALALAGAGYIGDYSHCTFNSEGVGTFKPEAGTNPFIGEQEKLEKVEEIKIETIFPINIQNKVISSLIRAHPYEEVAYDIYPLDNKGELLGLGRVGYLPEEMSLKEFAIFVKKAFNVDGLRVVGNLDEKVRKVAVLGGDGNKYVSQAQFKGADVFVTGDVYYHVAHDAMMDGLNLVDPGHNIEKIMKEAVKNYLAQFILENKYDTKVISSSTNTDPFTFL
ncbi:Nif3-like dinuclear metal center hexameric protein [Anaerobacillus alkalilacustris]|uniref:GTP cyclohydrolase 1 type 2 homolog n=1 Tax=Anaerobacillus alkalilacustris TaxID=393763 RepID=A0A1S2LW20_9BACI|nr:Nif3-like dinuclear metal center hexameric protein [Anaerobacillus alkalilacustris]OIJ16709.1 Nif3-like dinuclear metal center hexameric protein [Anaerobacillus alkalilacustris]